MDKIDNLTTYSTTETIIGTWIDSKPIYRKCFTFISTWTAGARVALASVSNLDIENLIHIYGTECNGSIYRNIPHNYNIFDTSAREFFSIWLQSGSLMFMTSTSLGSATLNIILEYTKTID